MRRLLTTAFFLLILGTGWAQPDIKRPRLVVGIVLDQMRWDYLYRYYDRYSGTGGFKRMLGQGFACENTLIPYAPTITACGHSSIYTGSVPAVNGITGNTWWDKEQMKTVYCTDDKSVNTVGSTSALGKMSPRNLLVTTICDELRLATNFRSKVIGVAIKDRGGILPAGHSANAAYWYDNTNGNWISSTYYMKELPRWVSDFNSRKIVDHYYEKGWSLLYPAGSYVQSTADDKAYEAKPFGAAFPYDLKKWAGKDYGKISATPMGNSMTFEFAKAALQAEQLGADNITDFLAVSFSSPDYIGHTFGPNSVEAEDGFLRMDRELGDFLNFLDAKVGKGQYTVFLSADHGAAHVPEFMQENRLPGGRVFMGKVIESLNKELAEKYHLSSIIVSDDNYQVHLNHPLLDSARADKKEITQWIVSRLQAEPGIDRVFALDDLNQIPLPERIREMLNNGFYPRRNGDIQFIPKPGYIDAYSNTGTTHGLWNPYDAHIPLLWYGWGIKTGRTNRETHMTDIAPTLASLLHIQMPSGTTGQAIPEVLK
ncbi:MAG: alkaline phosphatase family protein [Sphingobacteriales bacterium]|nr:alkaline phosphatase family protein [Sphingobacteriales bacterium]